MKERLFDLLNQSRKLRQLFVVCALLLLPIGAWAQDYKLFIGDYEGYYDNTTPVGVKVTSANASDIKDGCIQTGSVRFDYQSRTLTLENAIINGSIYSGGALTINLIGENYITAADSSAIVGEGADAALNLTIKGTGTLLAKGTTAYVTDGFNDPTFQDGQSLLLWDGYDETRVFTTLYGPQLFSGGNGNSPDTPYLISTVDDLNKLAFYVNEGLHVNDEELLNSKSFELQNDIDCTNKSGFVPIGNSVNNPFIGTFNGNNKKIIGLNYTTTNTADYVGLFGRVGIENGDEGTIVNLELKDCSFGGGVYAGAIAGSFLNGSMQLCKVSGNTTISAVGDDPKAGALIGNYSGGALTGNYYYYTVTTSTQGPNDPEAVEISGHAERGLGNTEDITADDGAVLYTKQLTITGLGENCAHEGDPGYNLLADYENYIFHYAPGATISLYLYPNSDLIPSVTLSYTETGKTGPTVVPLEKDPDENGNIVYSFTMPDVDATFAITLTQGYALYIGDTQVTATNAADVLKDKKVSFTSYIGQNQELVNILTLNDATITVPIKIGLDNLTIDIQGTNTITTNTTCIQKMENTDPSLTFRSTGDVVGSLTLTHEGGVTEIGNVTISRELIPMLTVYGTEDYTSNMYYFTDGSTSMVKFLPSYGVKVGDTQIYSGNANDVFKDGTVKFDQETGTLTLSDASVGVVSTSLANLTIELEGNNMIAAGSSMATLQSMYGDPVTMTIQSTGETKGCLTMNQPYTREGTFADEHVTLNIVAPLAVVSGSLTGNNKNDNTLLIDEAYGLTVNGEIVSYMNKDNILKDKTASVRFNPETNTLSLYGAKITTTGDFVTSSLTGGLTVDLHGSSTLILGGTGAAFVSNISSNAVPLKFTTDATNSGQLSWTAGHDLYKDFDSPTYENSLALQSPDNLISKTPVIDYALTIGTIVVNSKNYTDVLGDGKVRFIAAEKATEENILVLENATITNMVIKSGLTDLTIHLLGENTIKNTDSENLLVSTVANAPLKIVTTPNIPGKLTLTKNTGAWISGFAAPTYPQNYTKVETVDDMIFSLVSTITPIVVDKEDGTQPKAEKEMQNPVSVEGTGNTNAAIDNVLYTVPKSNNSFVSGTSGNPDAVCLGVAPTETELSDAQTKIPGTDAFAAAFTGLTFEIPAGTGKVKVEAEIENGVKMAIKIGSNAAELFPKDGQNTYNVLTTYEVPYSVTVPTYVYVYLAESGSSSRSEVRGRGKVLMGHVKVTTVGASSSSMVMDNNYSEEDNVVRDEVKLFSLPEGAVKTSGEGDVEGVVLSTVDVSSGGSGSDSRGYRRASETVKKPITELAPSVFDGLDKAKVRYVDISGTEIKDFTVNRSSGIMSGFGSNMLIYMPKGNDDGGESNVIVDGTCATLSLSDDNGFLAPNNFTATKAQLNREFTSGRTSTVFLPFALSKEEADALGTFHTFDKIENNDAKFNEAETDGTKANMPYIFVPKATGNDFKAENVTVEGFGASSVTKECMIGTYEKISWTTAQENIYGFAAESIGTVSAGQFVRVDAGAWIPPFRAYLMVNGTSAPRLNVVIAEGEATGISEIADSCQPVGNGEVYNLRGQRVSQPGKGMYIINGKKIMVK